MRVKKAAFDAALRKMIAAGPVPITAIPKVDGSERPPARVKPAKKRATR